MDLSWMEVRRSLPCFPWEAASNDPPVRHRATPCPRPAPAAGFGDPGLGAEPRSKARQSRGWAPPPRGAKSLMLHQPLPQGGAQQGRMLLPRRVVQGLLRLQPSLLQKALPYLSPYHASSFSITEGGLPTACRQNSC